MRWWTVVKIVQVGVMGSGRNERDMAKATMTTKVKETVSGERRYRYGTSASTEAGNAGDRYSVRAEPTMPSVHWLSDPQKS
jgi:hypothetical protein